VDRFTKQTLAEARSEAPALAVIDGGLGRSPANPTPTDTQHESFAAFPAHGGCSEISRAIDCINGLATAVADMHRLVRTGKLPELKHARQALAATIDDFGEQPDALFWALTANRRMYHLCRRSVGCAVWAMALGQQLGFARDELRELMLGALLLDIGKLRVPVVLLAKASKLNQAELGFIRRHVTEGIRLLEKLDGVSADIIEMVRSHHERIDGSGFPCRLKGDEISLYAQIAGIIDSYDALSLSRYYADGLSGADALSALQDESGEKFSARLLEQFRVAIGDMPVGTWVELKDGCTGVVCGRDTDAKDARVALIADEHKQPFLEVRWLSLHRHEGERLLPPDERPENFKAMERSLQSAIYAFRPRRY